MVSLFLISLKKNIAFTLEKSVFIHISLYFFSLQYLQWKFFSYLEFTLYCDCHQVFWEISDVHGPSSQQHSCFCTLAASIFSLCVEKLRYFWIISEKKKIIMIITSKAWEPQGPRMTHQISPGFENLENVWSFVKVVELPLIVKQYYVSKSGNKFSL